MGKSYTPYNFKKVFIRLKILTLITLYVVYLSIRSASAQVTITSPSLTVTACTTFPTNPGTLGDIVIAESTPNDISGSGTLILSTPPTFQFTGGGNASASSSDITNLSLSYTSSTTLTLSFTVSDSIQLDTIRLSGIGIRGIIIATSASNMIRSGGTSIIKGDSIGSVYAILTSTDAPYLTSSSTPPAICSGDTFNYIPTSSLTGTLFGWSRTSVTGISNTSNTGIDNPSETLVDTVPNSTNVTYEYTLSANGCTNPTTFSVIVTVNPLPVLTSTLTPPSICSGTTFTYLPLSTTTGTSFSWTRLAITGISNFVSNGNDDPNEILTDTTTSPVNVTYIYSLSANGCINPTPDSVVVAVNPAPVMTSANTTTICNDDTLNIPLTSSISSSYLWIANDNTNITGESLSNQTTDTINNTLINNASSVQTVNYTITPTSIAANCTGSSQIIGVNILPTPTVSTNDSVVMCSGNALEIPLTSNVSSAYIWIASDNANTTGESVTTEITDTIKNTIINTTATIQTVIYTATPVSLTNNCAGTPKTIIVIVHPAPVLSSGNVATICSGSKANIPLTTNIASTYTWIASDNLNTTGESTTIKTADTINDFITTNALSVQTITYTVTPISISESCIGGTQTVDLTVNPSPVSDAGNDLTLCSGTTDSIGSAMVAGYAYSWSPTTGLSDSTASNPINTTTNNTNSPIVTNYILTTTSTATGCQSADSVAVTVNSQPVLAITYPAPVCFPNTIDITDSLITAGSTGNGIFSYWTNMGGTDTLQTPDAISTTDTSYIKLTGPGGCYDIDSVVSIINPLPASNAGNNLSICSGIIDSIGSFVTSGYTYSWSPGTGLSDSTIANPQITTLNSTSNPIVTSYILTTTITTTGCHSKDSVLVAVNPQPVLTITNPAPACYSDSIDLTAPSITDGSTGGGAFSYWTNTAATDVLQFPNAVAESDTNYIKVTATGGCTDIQPVITIINPLPLVSFTGLNYSNCYNSPPQTMTGSPPGGFFSGNGVVGDTFTASIAGSGVQPVTYTYIDTNGCSRSASQFIEILPLSNITPEICMVSVDSGSNHNIIYWDKTSFPNADSFIVYREIMPDSFARIGAVLRSALSHFTDTVHQQYFPYTGDPNIGEHRYKLQIRDTCGTYTSLSTYQKTIYLTHTEGTFSWTQYQIENQPTPVSGLSSYILLRDANSTGSWDVIASVSSVQLSVTDPDYAAYPNGRWRIETLWNISCTPSGAITTTRSNMITLSTIGIIDADKLGMPLSIYPNPYSQSTTIKYILNKESNVFIEVYNSIGQKIRTLVNTAQTAGEYNYQFSAKESGYSGGIYFVKISINGKTTIKRIVETE